MKYTKLFSFILFLNIILVGCGGARQTTARFTSVSSETITDSVLNPTSTSFTVDNPFSDLEDATTYQVRIYDETQITKEEFIHAIWYEDSDPKLEKAELYSKGFCVTNNASRKAWMDSQAGVSFQNQDITYALDRLDLKENLIELGQYGFTLDSKIDLSSLDDALTEVVVTKKQQTSPVVVWPGQPGILFGLPIIINPPTQAPQIVGQVMVPDLTGLKNRGFLYQGSGWTIGGAFMTNYYGIHLWVAFGHQVGRCYTAKGII